MLIVLGVDTAGGACSVAVRRNGRTLAARQRRISRGHAEALVPMVLETFDDAGIDPNEVELYGVTVGPGAFTGLRVGLATVSGLALAHDRPIVGIGSFEAAAASAWLRYPESHGVLVALESRRVELFACLFSAGDGGHVHVAGEPWASAPAKLAAGLPTDALTRGLIVAGDAAAAAGDALMAAGITLAAMVDGPADPGLVAAIAETRCAAASRNPPAPVYLRAPDARPAVPARAMPSALQGGRQ